MIEFPGRAVLGHSPSLVPPYSPPSVCTPPSPYSLPPSIPSHPALMGSLVAGWCVCVSVCVCVCVGRLLFVYFHAVCVLIVFKHSEEEVVREERHVFVCVCVFVFVCA